MGLFGKKKATTASETEVAPDATPTDAPTPAAAERPSRHHRRKVSVAEMEALRADVVDLRTRLVEAEKAKWLMEHRLRALDATTTTLADSRATLTELTGKVQSLELQVGTGSTGGAGGTDTPAEAGASAISDFGSKLAGLEAKLTELQTKLDTPPSPVLTPRPLLPTSTAEPSAAERERHEQLDSLTQRVAAVDELSAQVAQLAERLAATDSAARSTGDHVAAIDERLNNISTELANQISELGRDIDALADRSPDAPASAQVSDELIDALRAGQVKLANEQARYEIAFRQDLAALAEQLRHAARR
jgi:hypothetical protein